MTDKTPYRTEEALERFIIVTNSGKFFNQIPIGGGKESIDIGIEETDSEFSFVELKPWNSSNSPMYAIVESLKNLTEYRVILEKKIKDIRVFDKINLIILAPWSYYEAYGLISSSGICHTDKISILRKTLDELSSEFGTNICLMALQLDHDSFNDACRRICDRERITEQKEIGISGKDAIPELKRDRWELLVSSDKMP
ncbi:MAG: hypothetical protein JRJ38_10530 [Deltaproteobacteria bacterium]|nr:hypothetical protein [Deltaproteobacteria bacterium]